MTLFTGHLRHWTYSRLDLVRITEIERCENRVAERFVNLLSSDSKAHVGVLALSRDGAPLFANTAM